MIVVLKTPSLAQRVAARRRDRRARAASAPGRTTSLANAEAPRLAARAAGRHRASRLQLRARARRLLRARRLERDPDHRARRRRRRRLSRCASRIRRRSRRACSRAPTSARSRATARTSAMSGVDGRGVTIALLDTGVDPARSVSARARAGRGSTSSAATPVRSRRSSPTTRRRSSATARRWRACSSAPAAPSGLAGVATGASVLPIRVAGWQPDALGHWAIYARSDQIIAGLERAVDPNDDGDAHDAARVALVALAEPFAGFADGPEARAAAGALALDTLVVAPAGNDGRAAAGYGDISGPGGAPGGAHGRRARRAHADRPRAHRRARRARDAARRHAPLAGAVRPAQPARPRASRCRAGRSAVRGAPRRGSPTSSRASGLSIVAGRAALVPIGASPAPAAARAAAAGASAVLLYGGRAALPAGGLGLDESIPIPVVSIPTQRGACRARAHRARPAGRRRARRGAQRAERRAGRVASFSSSGLAFDGRVKPDLVAPGVGLATSDPGANADGSPRFVTVNGSSAAAATVAGAAALLAQARPSLGAERARAACSSARRSRSPTDPVTAAGRRPRRRRRRGRRRGRRLTGDARARTLDRRGLAREGVVHAHEPLDAHRARRRSACARRTRAPPRSTSSSRPKPRHAPARARACSCT